MLGRDLGTYHVRVVFATGEGFICKWETGSRYCFGRNGIHPLNADRIGPSYESEAELIDSVEWMFNNGNYACDCNLSYFLADSKQEDRPLDPDCGDTMELRELTLIRPDGAEIALEIERP